MQPGCLPCSVIRNKECGSGEKFVVEGCMGDLNLELVSRDVGNAIIFSIFEFESGVFSFRALPPVGRSRPSSLGLFVRRK